MNPLVLIPLVNVSDEIIGHAEKMDVHIKGLLHRAFSILIFDYEGKMLIHKRALHKYHSAGLWTNACCGHPNQDENIMAATHRRLKEEMGFDCELYFLFKMPYKAVLSNDLIENEIDYIFKGVFNGKINANIEEVSDFEWINVESLKNDISQNPNKYTVWFKEIMLRV